MSRPTRARVVVVGALLPVAMAAALATGTALAATSHATAAPRIVPACTWGQIDSWLNTTGNGYAGGIGYQLQLTNISLHKCSLYGFPGVSAVSLTGHQIGGPATESGTRAHVTVNPGATAKATLLITDTANFPPSACKAVTAAGLRVYAPGFTRSQVIPYPFSVCSNVHTVSITIEPVT